MRWRILALLFAVRVGLGFQFQTLGSVGDDLVAAFGLDYADVGTLVGLFMLPGIVLALPAGYAGRYLSDRWLASLGMLGLGVGGATCGLADAPWLIGLGRAICGAGFLVTTLYLTKMTADWFAGREIATAMSVLVMSWPFGIALGQVSHAWIALQGGWRWPFIVAAAYCLAGAVALLAGYRAPASTAADAATAVRPNRRELHLTAIAALSWAVFNAGYIVYLTFGPLALQAQGQDAIEAATTVSVGSWLMILSGVACGQIADRTGRPDLALAVCMIGAMAALALLPVSGAGLAASLLFGLVGMAPAGVIMALTGEAMRPQARAFGMGVFFSIYFLVNAATPPLAGWLYDLARDPRAPIVVGIALFGLVIAANGWFRATQRRHRRAAPSDPAAAAPH